MRFKRCHDAPLCLCVSSHSSLHRRAFCRLRRLIRLAHGHDAENHAAAREVFVRDSFDVGGRYREGLGVVDLIFAGIAVESRSVRESHRLAEIGLETANKLQLQPCGRSLYLFRSWSIRLEAFENRIRGLFQFSERVSRSWRNHDLKLANSFAAVLARTDRCGSLLVVNK